MEARAASPPAAAADDRSDGNEPLSAPSEFLAEFLSAIMRQQYAEALKYCRLILQYEPHNATARGFYPLLQHKLRQHRLRYRDDEGEPASSSEDSEADESPSREAEQLMQQSSSARSAGGSASSQSSLELDPERADDADDNGNALPPSRRVLAHAPEDLENDNTAAASTAHLQDLQETSAATLRRLRAHFACSIK